MSSKVDNPYLRKEGDDLVITEEGYKKLDEIVTDLTGQVYAFTGELSPVIIAAAMARLSRRMGDMRVTILDEFMLNDVREADFLIQRVVSEYGDDSVQQLVGIPLVVEEASNLLTKLLEWGRFAAYLEQSTRYIFFDKKDVNGKFRYYTPLFSEILGFQGSGELEQFYTQTMDNIFETYSLTVRGVTEYLRNKFPAPQDKQEKKAWMSSTRATACDAVRPVLPAAVKSTVGIFASAQAVDRLIMNLMSEPLLEARVVGEKILREARKIIPAFLERTDRPDRGGMITAHRGITRSNVQKLARQYLNYSQSALPYLGVKLVSFWPSQELDLVPEMLFEHAGPLSLSDIVDQVNLFSHERKVEIFKAYMGRRLNRRNRPGRALEKAHFEFEMVGDYGTFRDLQRHRVVDAMEWQRLTPDFGDEVPELICEAGFGDEFRKCFSQSRELYDRLNRAINDNGVTAQYAVLLGHRMRYRFIMNLRQLFHLFELRTGPSGHPGYRKLCLEAHELLGEVYPVSAEAMQFVNKGEDPELTRMAAEIATQHKLEQFDSLRKEQAQ